MTIEKNCKACGEKLTGKFCSTCGQKVIEGRFTMKQIFADALTAVFNVEKGFFFTIIKLYTQPATVVKGYINGITKNTIIL